MGSENQVAKRNFFQEWIYQMAKRRFDEMQIEINGNRPEDVQVHNDQFYIALAKYVIGINRVAFGESYMDGDWDSEDLVGLFEKFTRTREFGDRRGIFIANFSSLPLHIFNMQNKLLSKQNVSSHYDIGNDLFKLMLDRSMNYSCGYWRKNATMHPLVENANQLCETLDEAQLNKMLLIGKKLSLKPGMKVLDIGCGWGYLAKFLAINFDVNVVGITISTKQYEYATTTDLELNELDFLRIKGLNSKGTGKYEFRLQDYRDVDEKFDRIVSVGMIEHVGKKNYAEFFDICRASLPKDGLLLLHTIGLYYHKLPQVDAWMNKYIFPGGMVPYHTQLIDAFYGKFIIEDWHNFGYDYYRTLMVWMENFNKAWPKLEGDYSLRFKRMWHLYLNMSAVMFKTRKCALWQIVLSRNGLPEGYNSYR